jgi:hypothetical protein
MKMWVLNKKNKFKVSKIFSPFFHCIAYFTVLGFFYIFVYVRICLYISYLPFSFLNFFYPK